MIEVEEWRIKIGIKKKITRREKTNIGWKVKRQLKEEVREMAGIEDDKRYAVYLA